MPAGLVHITWKAVTQQQGGRVKTRESAVCCVTLEIYLYPHTLTFNHHNLTLDPIILTPVYVMY